MVFSSPGCGSRSSAKVLHLGVVLVFVLNAFCVSIASAPSYSRELTSMGVLVLVVLKFVHKVMYQSVRAKTHSKLSVKFMGQCDQGELCVFRLLLCSSLQEQ